MHRVTYETMRAIVSDPPEGFRMFTIVQSGDAFFIMMLQHAIDTPRCTTTFV
jgi:hypothetical protein